MKDLRKVADELGEKPTDEDLRVFFSLLIEHFIYFILFCFILFCFVLFYFILFCFFISFLLN